MQTIVNVENLCYRVGARYLLDHINWKVQKGEHWLILGMNGSGKTTLLSAVAGYQPISSGSLEVLGQKYDKDSILALRKEVGFVSYSFFSRYFRNETVLHVVLSALSGSFNVNHDVTANDVRKAKWLLQELGIEDKANAMFYRLSKGEQQDVLIARALITAPKVLILDEPCLGLDICARAKLMHTVQALADTHQVTILYVSHYPEEIQPFMNKTILMKNGKIFASGETQQVITSKNMTALVNHPVVVQHEDGAVNFIVKSESNIKKLYDEQEGSVWHG